MASNLHEVPVDQLDNLLTQCIETMNAVCDRLEQDTLMTIGLRDLMKSTDMLQCFEDLCADNRKNASILLHAAVAVLVNTQSVRTIQAEKQRRLSGWN